MYNILISGYYGFDNIGDESILRTLVTSLRERIPDCSLTVLSHDPAATREKYGVEAVERMSPLAIARAVRRCDMLISGGGSLLQDVTSSKSLHYYLAIIRFAQLLGKKGFFYSQGIGPIEKDADRRATARALRRADGIVVRDERSAALLAEIGVPAERVVITADPVIRMKKTDRAVGETILCRAGVTQDGRPVVGWADGLVAPCHPPAQFGGRLGDVVPGCHQERLLRHAASAFPFLPQLLPAPVPACPVDRQRLPAARVPLLHREPAHRACGRLLDHVPIVQGAPTRPVFPVPSITPNPDIGRPDGKHHQKRCRSADRRPP